MKCSYLGCKNSQDQCNPDLSFFRYPIDESLRREWIQRTGAKSVSKWSRVCSEHFDLADICFKRGPYVQVKPDSVPFDCNGRQIVDRELKHEPVVQLSYSYVDYDGPHVCRLCRRRPFSLQTDLVKWCYGNNGTMQADNAVAEVLNLHFWFKLGSDGDAASFVCQPCWLKVHEFHLFYMQVQAIHGNTVTVKLETEDPIAIAQQCVRQPNVSRGYQLGSDDQAYSTILAAQKREREKQPAQHVIKVKSIKSILKSHVQPFASLPPQHINNNVQQRLRSIDQSHAETPPLLPNESKLLLLPAAPIEAAPSFAPFVLPAQIDDPEIAKILETAEIAKYFNLKCEICAEPVRNLLESREHNKRMHEIPNGYMRCKCGKRFTHHNRMMTHCAFHANPAKWKCIECCMIFVQKWRFAAHLRRKHPAQMQQAIETETYAMLRKDDVLIAEYFKFGCDVCEQPLAVEYETFEDWRQHHRDVHGALGALRCCGKVFREKRDMLDHSKWHRNPHEFRCSICSSDHKNRHLLQLHRDAHHPNDCDELGRCFECYRCHRPYVTWRKLRFHMQRQHSIPTHFCPLCAAGFANQTLLDAHQTRAHLPKKPRRPPKPQPVRQCPLCGKWLRSQLTQHMFRCRKEPNRCPQCAYVAIDAADLVEHRQRVHPTRRSRICPVCGKQLSATYYPTHMRWHTEPRLRRHACGWCPKMLSSPANVIRHRWTAHEQLVLAEKAAKVAAEQRRRAEWRATRQQLRANNADGLADDAGDVSDGVDEVVAMPAKPVIKKQPKIQCQLCPAVLRSKFYLTLHMEKHANAPPRYKCDFCGKAFRIPNHMINHRNKMHPELEQQRRAAKVAEQERLLVEWKAQQQAVDSGGLAAAAMVESATVEEVGAAVATVAEEQRDDEAVEDVVEESLLWNFCEIVDE